MALSRILNDWSEREESKVLINLIKTNWINRSQLQLLIYKVFWKLTNSVSKSVPPTAEIPCFLCEILPNGMATWNPDGRHVVQRREREQSSPLSLFGGGNFRQLQMGTSSTWKGRRGGKAGEEPWRIDVSQQARIWPTHWGRGHVTNKLHFLWWIQLIQFVPRSDGEDMFLPLATSFLNLLNCSDCPCSVPA